MHRRDLALAILGVLAILALLGAMAYPAALDDPWAEDAEYEYTSVNVASPEYHRQVNGNETVDELRRRYRVRHYENLSPAGQRFFDHTRTDATGLGRGTYEPRVCKPRIRNCPTVGHDEVPPELATGFAGEMPDPNASMVVVTEDGVYAFWTEAADPIHTDGIVWIPLEWVVDVVTPLELGAYVLFLGVFGVGSSVVAPASIPRLLRGAAILNGFAIAALAIATPYVVIWVGVGRSVLWLRALVLLGLILAGGTALSLLAVAHAMGGENRNESEVDDDHPGDEGAE